MGKKSGPKAPDPIATSKAQADSNAKTAITEAQLNRYDQYGLGGSLVWEKTGDPNDPNGWASRVVLDPENQVLYDANMHQNLQSAGMASTVGQQLQNELQKGYGLGLPAIQSPASLMDWASGQVPSSDTETYKSVADALYNQQVSRLDPRFAQQQSDMESKLAAQGITQGSAAYDREVQNMARAKNDAYSQAMQASISGADSVLNNQFNRELQAALAQPELAGANYNLQKDYRGTMLDEQNSTRSNLINQMAALRGNGQTVIPQFNQQSTGSAVGGTDVSGNVYNSYQANAQRAQQQASNTTATIGTVASIAIAL